MTTCGMYNAAGDWVTEVGLPAKSGVGGGILAVLPGQIGLAVFSPRLDEHGNSVRGVQACRRLSKDLELHFMHVSRAARSAVRASYDVVEAPSRRRRSPPSRRCCCGYGRRARVYELHGDLLFAGAESVIRGITAEAGDLDVMVLDVRGVDETADVSRRMMVDMRDQLRAVGSRPSWWTRRRTVVELDPDPAKRVRHFTEMQRGGGLRRGRADRSARRARPRGPGHPDPGAPAAAGPARAPAGPGAAPAGAPDLHRRRTPSSAAATRRRGCSSCCRHGGGQRRAGADVRHHLSMFTAGTTFGVAYAVAGREYDIDATRPG